ncbi:hypothetical protein ABZX72_19745 [Streptomyces cyaneofuscatus]|uniref:hypothetical protein n=1 Tax=Streptomyces cyaneofuscatus TaxID=66883 RepID=UPI0033A347C2
MGTQQVSAPLRAPSSGIVHINIRLTDGYSIISNRLSQHRDLSLLAIGLGTHIQSLPAGADPAPAREPEAEPEREPEAEPVPEPEAEPVPEPEAEPVPEEPAPAPAPRLVPPPTAPRPPRPPLPGPCRPTEALYATAADLLAGLRRTAPVFVLSEEDVRRLVPGVAAWLERGMRPDAVREALTDDPPVPLRHPAKLLRHRLITLLPPPLPVAAPVVPLQNCDDCDRAFRSPVAGVCRGCGEARAEGAEPFRLSA